MEVLVLPTPADVAGRAAEVVLHGLAAAARPEPVLGLATGSSPLGLYARLARALRPAGSGRTRRPPRSRHGRRLRPRRVRRAAGRSPAVLPRGAAARGVRAAGAATRAAPRA